VVGGAPARLDRAVTDRHHIVAPPELPEPSGYAHAVVAAPGRTVYLGGQTGAGETLAVQFDAAATALVASLRAAGGEPNDLVSVVVFTTDMGEYRASLRELGEVWRRHFGRRYPAMALIGASALFDPDARVELMGVAVVPE
jgi:enamine deaminase RidA (YjgF/YER057c/UK114 family)